MKAFANWALDILAAFATLVQLPGGHFHFHLVAKNVKISSERPKKLLLRKGSVAAGNRIFGASLKREFHGNLWREIPFLLEMDVAHRQE